MPTETAIVVAAVTIAFLAFALTLAWCDVYTNKTHGPSSVK
jgi:hypothetical protein